VALKDRSHVAELMGIVVASCKYLYRLGYAVGLISSITSVKSKFTFFASKQDLATVISASNDFLQLPVSLCKQNKQYQLDLMCTEKYEVYF